MNRKKLLLPALVLVLCLASFLPVKKKRLNVVFIGDSITHGTGPKDQSPPIFAGDFLRKLGEFDSVSISNQGVSGHTTVDFLPASKKDYPKVRAAATAFYGDKEADLVFSFMLGTNDSAITGPNGSPVSPASYRQNLKIIVDSLIAAYPNCRLVINYPIWYSNNTHNRGASYMQEGLDRLKTYLPEIDGLVKECKKTHPKHVFLGDTEGMTSFEKNYLTYLKPENGLDGTFYLHPNKPGDIALGELWGKAIEKAVH